MDEQQSNTETVEQHQPHVVFSKHLVKFSHINIREEKHGDDSVTAADLKLVASVSNAWLLNLDPGLREALYKKTERDLFPDQPDYFPDLRFHQLADLSWDQEWEEAHFAINAGTKKDRMTFTATIRKVRLSCLDGGSVTVTFNASVYPDPAQAGKLIALLGKEEKVTVQTDPDQVIVDDPAD